MKIYTDHKWKQFKYRNEVPASVLASQFDYQDPEETFDGFIHYRGVWYHLDQFMRGAPIPGWDGFAGDSFFSGVAIKLSSDGEEYQIATVIS